jgi:hypothetical protein
MITCPLCQNEYIFFTKLCHKCTKIKNLGRIYGIDHCIDLLEGLLIVKHDEELDDQLPEKKVNFDIKKNVSFNIPADLPTKKPDQKYKDVVKKSMNQ